MAEEEQCPQVEAVEEEEQCPQVEAVEEVTIEGEE